MLKIALFHTCIISAEFFQENVLFGGDLQIGVKGVRKDVCNRSTLISNRTTSFCL